MGDPKDAYNREQADEKECCAQYILVTSVFAEMLEPLSHRVLAALQAL